jgi:flagellar protein FliO/FliZ
MLEEYLSAIIMVVLFLVILIALSYVIKMYAKRNGNFKGTFGGTFGGIPKNMNVIERLPLGQDKSLLIVEVADKTLLIGVTNQNITCVSELDPKTILTPPPPEPISFSKILENVTNKGKNKKTENFSGYFDSNSENYDFTDSVKVSDLEDISDLYTAKSTNNQKSTKEEDSKNDEQ